jgi:phage gp36-like protein
MKTERADAKLIEEAKAALERKEWQIAYAKLKEARALNVNRAEVDRWRIEVKYREHVFKGKEAMDVDDPDSALGYFMIAKTAKDTDELKEWIAKAQKRKEEKKSSP